MVMATVIIVPPQAAAHLNLRQGPFHLTIETGVVKWDQVSPLLQ